MNDYSEITSLLKEIEFYEARGMHKLADQITNKIKKVAYQFSADQDLGYKGMNDFFEALKAKYLCKIPECYEFFCGASSGNLDFMQDYKEVYIQKMKENPNLDPRAVLNEFNEKKSQEAEAMSALSGDQAIKFRKCQEKINNTPFDADQQLTQLMPKSAAVPNALGNTASTQAKSNPRETVPIPTRQPIVQPVNPAATPYTGIHRALGPQDFKRGIV